jgi:hypothetical protein
MESREMEEIKRHFGVVAEALRNEIQQIGEGIENVDEKMDRFRLEVQNEFKEIKTMIKFSYAELDRRITEIEVNFTALQQRVERLEVKKWECLEFCVTSF